MERWELGAAESLLLQKGPKTGGAEVLKMGLTELVATRRLRLDEGRKPRLRRGPARPGRLRPSLRALLDLFDQATVTQDGVEVAKFAQAVARRYGSLGGYRDKVVLAGMVDDGLFAREQYRVLWVFPAMRYVPTLAGQSARQRLDDLQRRIEADPAAALPDAGAAMLLVPAVFPELREAVERTRRREYAGDGGASSGGGAPYDDADGHEPPAPPDLGSGPAATPTATLDSVAFDFASLDFAALDAAVGAIDAGVSDGGGDGGGGDGGGGGGDGGSS